MREKTNTTKLLVVDDTPENLELVVNALQCPQLQIMTASGSHEGMRLYLEHRPAAVLLDLVMPEVKDMDLLDAMVAADPAAEIILMTAHYSTESAVRSIQKGAADYLTKPLDLAKLRNRILVVIGEEETRRQVFELEHALTDAYQFEGIIGRSPVMLETFAKIRRVAPHFQTILVTGETGTGKELVARALHDRSSHSSGPFVACNCSALVETLIESELFGYVRGAFTGATQDKIGLFEAANGGTVFLDEIGELSATAQAKLLRVLQEKEVQRVGSPKTYSVDVKVIGATHRDLLSRVGDGRFREDLYYRLSMAEIRLPRLADRKEDLTLLLDHLVKKYCTLYRKEIKTVTRRAQLHLARHTWPGNVRELENVIGSACMMAQGPHIDMSDLPSAIQNVTKTTWREGNSFLTMEEMQRRHLLHTLEQVEGNKARAAAILGISRATVYEMLSKIKTAQKSGVDKSVYLSVRR